MSEHSAPRSIASLQLVAVLAASLALFFMAAFATKLVEAYRLRSWRDMLKTEIASMRREKQDLAVEVDRRKSLAWADEELRSEGWLPEGVIGFVPVPVPAGVTAPPQRSAVAKVQGPSARSEAMIWFNNRNWQAWRRLIWGFDQERSLYYNSP